MKLKEYLVILNNSQEEIVVDDLTNAMESLNHLADRFLRIKQGLDAHQTMDELSNLLIHVDEQASPLYCLVLMAQVMISDYYEKQEAKKHKKVIKQGKD